MDIRWTFSSILFCDMPMHSFFCKLAQKSLSGLQEERHMQEICNKSDEKSWNDQQEHGESG